MSVKREQALFKKASEAGDLILKCIEKGEVVHVISHFDADGLAAAGIIGTSLIRMGGNVHIKTKGWIDEEVANEVAAEKHYLTIFTDFGSGYLDLLGAKLPHHQLIIIDHHQPKGENPPNLIHVNPHYHGIDGSHDISGAGTAYFVAKSLDERNIDLAYLAIVGALGDMQDKYAKRGLEGANKIILQDAIKTGHLKLETDLLFFGRETRPIHKALSRTTNPFIPGISGEEDKSLSLLASLKISPKYKEKERWRALRDLSQEEKKQLFSALADHLVSKGFSSETALALIGNIYTLTREEPWTPLRDAREFSVLLNATGRMGKPGLGVAICMGDRGKTLDQTTTLLEEYRRTIMKYLCWVTEEPGRIEELNSIFVVRGDDYIDEKMIGTVSSILSISISNPKKPIIAYSTVREKEVTKISARALDILASKGVNLGEVLRIAAEKHLGRGGGHNIAAGAQVPTEQLDPFLKLVDDLVKRQLEETDLGG